MKKSRVDADMEISATEALTNAKLEVDRALALDKANKTLHRLLEEIPQESEVLKPHKARYVLRGFEEDVKDEDVFASTTMTASVTMLLSQATDLRNEGYTVFTGDVKTQASGKGQIFPPATVTCTSRFKACGADPRLKHDRCRHLPSGTSDINGLDGEAGHVASKVLAVAAHERTGMSKGMKEILRAVQACRGWHRLRPAKSRLPFPWLVVIPPINEMLRFGNLAAAQATAQGTMDPRSSARRAARRQRAQPAGAGTSRGRQCSSEEDGEVLLWHA